MSIGREGNWEDTVVEPIVRYLGKGVNVTRSSRQHLVELHASAEGLDSYICTLVQRLHAWGASEFGYGIMRCLNSPHNLDVLLESNGMMNKPKRTGQH